MVLLVCLMAATGCRTTYENVVDAARHPASVDAPASPGTTPTKIYAEEALVESVETAALHDHAMHDDATHKERGSADASSHDDTDEEGQAMQLAAESPHVASSSLEDAVAGIAQLRDAVDALGQHISHGHLKAVATGAAAVNAALEKLVRVSIQDDPHVWHRLENHIAAVRKTATALEMTSVETEIKSRYEDLVTASDMILQAFPEPEANRDDHEGGHHGGHR